MTPCIVSELNWRGLLYQQTDEKMAAWLNEKPRTVYAGFDPTADSLHAGHLIALNNLRRFQLAGHRPIALIGGATGMIGDPSGRDEERSLLTFETLQKNVAGLTEQISRFLDFDHPTVPAVVANNYDWFEPISCIDFLRDIGKHFPVNVMLAKDSVKSRLAREESGLSYTEFSYQLLQAYDFVHLYRQFDCELQIGGSDQWGNITAGVDLGRRMGCPQLYGMTYPLLTKSDGTKMGKSADGALWIDPARVSPYTFYQYWINLGDDDLDRCFRFFSVMIEEEIVSLLKTHDEDRGRREGQRRLAAEITKLVHGEAGLDTALKATEIFFGAEIADLSDEQLLSIFADVPSTKLGRDQLSGEGLGLLDAMTSAGLAKTKSEARRTVKQGGAYVNNRRESDVDRALSEADLVGTSTLVLRSGKKRYAVVHFE